MDGASSPARQLTDAAGGVLSLEVALLAVLLALLAVNVVLWLRRRRRLGVGAEYLAHMQGLSDEALALARRLAKAAHVPVLEFLTSVELFEDGTARALEEEPELASLVRELRHALHFDRLPAHAPLLSSRELSPGTAVELGALHGQVAKVDEVSFEVELRAGSEALVPGSVVTVGLVHAREARYELHCEVVAVRGGRLELAHDEAPVRHQHRHWARVPVAGQAQLRVVSWPGHALLERSLTGSLKEVGGGGASVWTSGGCPAGVMLAMTFSIGAEQFRGVSAVVVATTERDVGFELHLEFRELAHAERKRLLDALSEVRLGQHRLSHQPADERG